MNAKKKKRYRSMGISLLDTAQHVVSYHTIDLDFIKV